MVERVGYMEDLKSFREKDLIKVVTGIRRCGKSTLFEMYQQHLISTGVDEEQIISVNLEYGEFMEMDSYKELYDYVDSRLLPEKMNYIFLDEVQQVTDFQKAVDALYVKKNTDVYITGSNAYLLSGELATLLSGRYIEIKMLPLSFNEYIRALGERTDLERKYNDYLLNSSFPGTLTLSGRNEFRLYLEGIYNTIILKDVVSRRRIQDVEILQSVIRFMFDNVGNLCSSTKISNAMTSSGRKISVQTVENYLSYLTESFILYKATRYDIKGKQYLQSGSKYYIADIGLRFYLLGTKKADRGHILENIIYLELIRRGYEVYVGKMGNTEVDFVAINENGVEYYQVAWTVVDEQVLNRELKPLDSIADHNPKFLLTMDIQPLTSHNGIKQINAIDWLLDVNL